MDQMEQLRRLQELEAENERLRQSAAPAPGGAAAPATGRVIRDYLTRELSPLVATGDDSAASIHSMAEALMRDAVRERVSDVHIDPESTACKVRFRIDGALHDAAILSLPQARRLSRHFMTMADMDPVAMFKPEESRRRIPMGDTTVDVRLTFAPSLTGDKMNIRLLDAARVDTRLDSLGLVPDQLNTIDDWLANASGMFLVTGPTASGKTTTLYSILNELKEQERAIVTIEDPVEYQIDGITQMQVREERGMSFSAGIRAVLRLDPDYIMVGEIRDKESARSAMEAAASGRVVLSTLHSNDAVGAISSLRSWGLTDHEITATVRFIVAQRLVRTLVKETATKGEPTEREATWLTSMNRDVPDETYHPAGDGIGYKGRTGVFEVWQLSDRDYQLILNHADDRTIRRRLYQDDHISLIDDGLDKVSKGVTSVDELRRKLGLDPRSAVPVDREPASV